MHFFINPSSNSSIQTSPLNIRRAILPLLLFVISNVVMAQKPDYNKGIISLDGKEIAKVVKIKDRENLGLTSTYELLSLNNKKLIIATIASEFKPVNGDNSNLYYRFTFLESGQVAIFTLASLGTEKSFAKQIAESGIVTGDELNRGKVDEFIARKSRNPKKEVEYNLVERNRMMPVIIERDNRIAQGATLIGYFKDVTNSREFDTYEFTLPEGLVVAKVSFAGRNNAQTAQFYTLRDNISRNVNIEDAHKIALNIITPGVDRNNIVLKRLAQWLVSNRYL